MSENPICIFHSDSSHMFGYFLSFHKFYNIKLCHLSILYILYILHSFINHIKYFCAQIFTNFTIKYLQKSLFRYLLFCICSFIIIL
eukprot:UN05327